MTVHTHICDMADCYTRFHPVISNHIAHNPEVGWGPLQFYVLKALHIFDM